MKHITIALIALFASVVFLSIPSGPVLADGVITDTYWLGTCSAAYSHSFGQTSSGAWSDAGITQTIPVSNTLAGMLGIENVTSILPWFDSAAVSTIWPPDVNWAWLDDEAGTPVYGCTNDDSHLGACLAIGYSISTTKDISAIQSGNAISYTMDGNVSWVTSVVFTAKACPIWYGTPPEACPNEWFTDTHFYHDTWNRAGSVSWTSSEYHLGGGGSVAKTITITDSGYYSMSVYAKGSTGGYLSLGLGSTYQVVTVPASTSYAWYSGQFSQTAGSVSIAVGAGAGTTGLLDIDRVCLVWSGTFPLTTECIVVDPDFYYLDSWTVPGGTVRATMDNGGTAHGWILTHGFLEQEVPATVLIEGTTYTVTVRARNYGAGTNYLSVYVDQASVPQFVITLTESSSLVDYVGSFVAPHPNSGNLHTFAIGTQLLNVGNVIDRVCLDLGNEKIFGPGPCGINSAMMIESAAFLAGSDFEIGISFPDINITGIGFPLSFSSIIVSTWNARDWASSGLFGWAVDGRYQVGVTGAGNAALGLVPSPLSQGINQSLHLPLQDFTIVLRSKANYINSRLTVNGVHQSFTSTGEWTEYGFQLPHSGPGLHNVALSSDCAGTMCTGGISQDLDSVVIDDVYVVPGLFTCGEVITTPVTPIGQCLNANPLFAQGSAGWSASPGATIYAGSAELQPGAYIEQYIEASASSASYGNMTKSVVEGSTFTVYVDARLANPELSQSFSLILGASNIGSYTPTSSGMIERFVFTHTVPTGATTNGGILLRVIAGEDDPGTIVIHQVCVRKEAGDVISGSCLGEWRVGQGGLITETISYPDFVYNTYNLIANKTYKLQVSGVFAESGAAPVEISFYDTKGNEMASPLIYDEPTEFYFQAEFYGPVGQDPSAQFEELRVTTVKDVAYSTLCLLDGTTGPPVILPPGPLPYPTCVYSVSGQLLNGVFFGQPLYSVPNTYSGTMESDSYAAELIYNYAIFPLVCTELSIADWQYRTVKDWNGKWATFTKLLFTDLEFIIGWLTAIWAKIPTSFGGGDPGWLLDLLWMLLKLLFELLLFMLRLLGSLIDLLITALRDLILAVKAEDAVVYPFDCSGNEQWVCFGLASLSYLDETTGGQWFNTLAYIAVAVLTIWLVWWLLNQVKTINAGGDSDV